MPPDAEEFHYVLNEVHPDHPESDTGFVYLFRTADELSGYLEPWFVDEQYDLVRSDGAVCSLEVRDSRLGIQPTDQFNPDLLRRLLVKWLFLRGSTDLAASRDGDLDQLIRLAIKMDGRP